MNKRKILFGILSLAMMVAFIPVNALAAPQVQKAENINQFISQTETDMSNLTFEVSKTNGKTKGKTFKQKFGKDFSKVKGNHKKIVDAIESTDNYVVIGETDSSYTVASEYATKRIMVDKTLTKKHGAKKASTYNGETVLVYNTESDAEKGYDDLVKTYGEENVLVDVPVKVNAYGWGTEFMGLDVKTKEVSSSGNDVTVAILDTGINENHNIFSGTEIVKSKNILSSNGSYADDNGHGTMTAGIVAESTPSNVKIMAVKIMNANGEGSIIGFIQGAEYAAQNGASVINCSLGGEVPSNYIAAYDKSLKKIANNGVVICAASGNESADMDKTSYYPAESSYAICVGAINKYGRYADFSNYGENLDFCAPGVDVNTAYYSGNRSYCTVSGTSFSSPYIASCAALIKADKPNINLSSMKSELADIAIDYGTSGKDKYYGYGMPKFIEKVVEAPTEETTAVETPSSESEDNQATKPTTETQPTTQPITEPTIPENTKPSTEPTTEPEPIKETQPTVEPVVEKPTVVTPIDINTLKIKLAYTKATYSGKAKTPRVYVENLEQGKDFSVTYHNNINAGKATVTISGIGNYIGEKVLSFTIVQKQIRPNITLSQTKYAYDGKVKTPGVTVKYGRTVMKSDTYTVSYSSGRVNVGKYKVVVKMKGNYSGSATAEFQIVKNTVSKKATMKMISKYLSWLFR